MDPKTAMKLDEIDLLRYQNWSLRRHILDEEGKSIVQAMAGKYKADGEELSINVDTGELTRTQGPPKP